MSLQDKSFLRWFAGICGTLIVAMVVAVISVISSVDVMAEKINDNSKDIIRIETIHETDKQDMNEEHKDDMKELKDGQKIMQADIKKLLIKTGGI